VTVSRQNARNWDTFLQEITDSVKSSEAVRDLCTPTGGTIITCYDDLVDKECYVALGRAKFRDIGYVVKRNINHFQVELLIIIRISARM